AICQPDEELREEAPPRSIPHVVDLEAEVVVLDVAHDVLRGLEHIGCEALPAAVADHMADLRLDRRNIGLRGVPAPQVARRADRRVLVEDQIELLRVVFIYAAQAMLNDTDGVVRR